MTKTMLSENLPVNYTVTVRVLKPMLKSLPEGFKISAYREVKEGKETVRYDIYRLSSKQKVAGVEITREKGELFIHGMNVLPEYRNNGFGSYLIDTILVNYAESNVYLVVRAEKGSLISKDELIKFYTKRGFVAFDKKGTMVHKSITQSSKFSSEKSVSEAA